MWLPWHHCLSVALSWLQLPVLPDENSLQINVAIEQTSGNLKRKFLSHCKYWHTPATILIGWDNWKSNNTRRLSHLIWVSQKDETEKILRVCGKDFILIWLNYCKRLWISHNPDLEGQNLKKNLKKKQFEVSVELYCYSYKQPRTKVSKHQHGSWGCVAHLSSIKKATCHVLYLLFHWNFTPSLT